MSKSPMPDPVYQADVERGCSLDPKGPVCARLKEQLAAWQKWERERAAAAAALEETLRGRFFLANPTVVEDDWRRLRERVIDDHLVVQMHQQGDREVEGLAARFSPLASKM